MWDIARAHGTSVEWLTRTNNISSRGKIYPGQLLKVPGDRRGATTADRRSSPAAKYGDYRVRPGDSLWDIAKRHHTSVATLASLNNISSRGRIYPGQTLRVPSVSGSISSKAFAYVVRRGDNLSRIASRFGIGVRDLIEFNHIVNPDQISVGMRLTIPAGS
jgi:LysM repeat protein